MMGVAGVLSRIAELNTQLGLTPAATTTAGTSGTAFASALADATAGTTTSSGATGADVVAAAKKYLGTPYVFGSTDPDKGLDCSALVQRAYRDLGIELPRTSREQARAGTATAWRTPGPATSWRSTRRSTTWRSTSATTR